MESIKYINEQLNNIGALVAEHCSTKGMFSIPDTPTHTGAPHVEINAGEYHYVITERGSELERMKTTKIDELMFWIVSGDIFEIACDWEVANRKVGEDSRRQLFAKVIELLHRIKPEWAVLQESIYREILNDSPYNDSI